MIKIRLHGTEEEIERFNRLLNKLEETGDIEIMSESSFYKDRGEKTKYGRVYLDVENLSK